MILSIDDINGSSPYKVEYAENKASYSRPIMMSIIL